MTAQRFSLSAIRASGVDVDSWQEPELGSLPAENRIQAENRIAAIKCYINNDFSLREIKNKYGIGKSTLYRLIERASSVVDGEVVGFMVAVPYIRISNRKDLSRKITRENAENKSGIFTRLLNSFPNLGDVLIAQTIAFRKGQKRISDLHQDFLKECREIGLGENDYPFNDADYGRRSFENHLKKKNKEIIAENELAYASRNSEKIEPTEPLDEVEVDGHEIDIRLMIEERDLYGEVVRYEILRVWLILIIDVFSRCILGYSIALGKNYDQQDVLAAIFNSLAPHCKPEMVIKGAIYDENGGFPSDRGAMFTWATWRSIKLDNALSHKAIRVKEILDKKVGCLIDYGPPHQPNARSVVERFFRFVADNFSHRVTGTTGSDVKDPVRVALSPSLKSGLSLLMTLDELKHAIDIVLSDYNGKPHSGICGNSPLNLFTSRVAKRSFVVGRLKPDDRKEYDFLKRVQVTTVRSSKKEIGAYINFANVRYKDPLVLRSDLVGRKIQFTYDERDISHVRAFTMDGKFIGALKASGPWGKEKHSLRLRQTLFKAFRDRIIKFKEGQSLLDACHNLRERTGINRTSNTAHYEITQSLQSQVASSAKIPSSQEIKPLVAEVVAIHLTKVFVL